MGKEIITAAAGTEANIIYESFPGTSQELALDSRANHTLYHGTRGPGKTITQLMFGKKFIGIGYGHHMRIIVLDREYKNLSDIIAYMYLNAVY